jgi:hypothetical protein
MKAHCARYLFSGYQQCLMEVKMIRLVLAQKCFPKHYLIVCRWTRSAFQFILNFADFPLTQADFLIGFVQFITVLHAMLEVMFK